MSTKNKILYIFIIPAFILCFFVLSGCSNKTNSTINKLSENMNKTIDTINELDPISNNVLIISDFMDEGSLYEIPEDKPTLYNSQMGLYITKLTLLNNAIVNTVNINNNLENIKKQVISKLHQIKSYSHQTKDDKQFSKNDINAMEEINSLIMSNCTRLALTRNEVKNNLQEIEEIKNEYNQKTEILRSKYGKLETSLNTRCLYLNNINNNLQDLELLFVHENKNISFDNEIEESYNNLKEEEKLVKTKGNIDTYENAGSSFWQNRNKQPIYRQDNYLNNGYNYTPNYNPYSNPYGYNGYGGMYGYGNGALGMPFGRFMIPNINTFGIYKNIDTYKSPKIESPTINPENNEYNEESTTTSSNCLDSSNINIQYYVATIDENGNVEILQNESYEIDLNDLYKPKTLEEPIIDNKNVTKQSIDKQFLSLYDGDYKIPEEWHRGYKKAIPEEEYIKDIDQDDGEDKFVYAPYTPPKFKKLK